LFSIIGSPRRLANECGKGFVWGFEGYFWPLHALTFFPIPDDASSVWRSFNTWLNRLLHATSRYQPQINLAWLSRKSIIFPTISMVSFEDSPDADRHGGYSILR
jgi:hypothetical protein